MERMEQIEEEVEQDFNQGKRKEAQLNIIEMNNKTLVGQKTKETNEKMKGHFQVKVNRQLEFGT